MKKLTSILVIDDDPTSRFLTEYIIEEMDLADAVYLVPGGQEALELIETLPMDIDLILLDINMPNMDGFEFLEAFHQLPNYKSSSIIMLTTSSNRKDVEKANTFEVAGYLNKPITKEKLLEVVGK